MSAEENMHVEKFYTPLVYLMDNLDFNSPRRGRRELMLFPRHRSWCPDLVKVFGASPVSKLLPVLSLPNLPG